MLPSTHSFKSKQHYQKKYRHGHYWQSRSWLDIAKISWERGLNQGRTRNLALRTGDRLRQRCRELRGPAKGQHQLPGGQEPKAVPRAAAGSVGTPAAESTPSHVHEDKRAATAGEGICFTEAEPVGSWCLWWLKATAVPLQDYHHRIRYWHLPDTTGCCDPQNYQ